jgi:hypothetical protein
MLVMDTRQRHSLFRAPLPQKKDADAPAPPSDTPNAHRDISAFEGEPVQSVP